MLRRAVALWIVATAVGCGGTTAPQAGDDSGGSGGSSGGSGGGSGGSGASSGGGGGGSSGSGSMVSNTSSTFGSATTAATNTTGIICGPVLCDEVDCPDGELIVPPGECCPSCACTGGECEPLDCPSGRVVMPAGACCAECADAQCAGVVCEGPTTCAPGYTFARLDGACCAACLPGPDGPACDERACPAELNCPLGYVAGDSVGGCCHECLPDPLYCADSGDCVMANRPRECCGCDEAINTRSLADNPCWVPVGQPWDVPEECYPEVTCDLLCGQCLEPGEAACVDNRCTQLSPQ